MKLYLWVALGGGVGSLLRYQIALWTLSATENVRFPIATLAVNVLGCFAVGLIWAWADRASGWNEDLRLALMVGLLGGFTTFSAFGLESFLMIKRGALGMAIFYVILSLMLGGLAIWMGWLLAGVKA